MHHRLLLVELQMQTFALFATGDVKACMWMRRHSASRVAVGPRPGTADYLGTPSTLLAKAFTRSRSFPRSRSIARSSRAPTPRASAPATRSSQPPRTRRRSTSTGPVPVQLRLLGAPRHTRPVEVCFCTGNERLYVNRGLFSAQVSITSKSDAEEAAGAGNSTPQH
jgi:hypothetical protein